MLNIKNLIKKDSIKLSNKDILIRYTKKLSDKITNDDNKIFEISYPNDNSYQLFGYAKQYECHSKKDILSFKNLCFDSYSYGDYIDEPIKIFGGIAFDTDENLKEPWNDVPIGKFFLPRFLISIKSNIIYISYFIFVNKKTNFKKIDSDYNDFLSQINKNKTSSTIKLDFEKNIPTKEEYNHSFNSIMNQINENKIEKIVLSRIKKYSATGNISIIKNYNQCTNFYIDLNNNKSFFGSTPELLIELNNKEFKSEAIAGTYNKELKSEDAIQTFLNNPKEVSEHQYVVEYIHNILAKYSDNLYFNNKPDILELKHLYHLHTPINGTLNSNIHILELLKKLHPTPAVLGTPKKDAMDLSRNIERYNRGWYSGCIGWFDLKGNGRFDVAIRSALKTQNSLYCFAGGGIIKDSNIDDEWNEAELKFQHLLSLLNS